MFTIQNIVSFYFIKNVNFSDLKFKNSTLPIKFPEKHKATVLADKFRRFNYVNIYFH